MTTLSVVQRIRAFCFGAIGVAYYYLAYAVAMHSAAGLSSADWVDVVGRLMLLFLLLLGYGVFNYVFQVAPGRLQTTQNQAGQAQAKQNQGRPFYALGLKQRPGWQREFGLGLATGWGALVIAILPVVLGGSLFATLWGAPRQWFLLLLDVIVLLAMSLGEELMFRGYALQRFMDAFGPTGATLAVALLAAGLQVGDPFAPRASTWVAFFFSWLLSVGYLRTRALWLPWGLRFGWYAATSLLFGLPIGGVSRYTPVVQSSTRGTEWFTGGDYGPDAAGFTVLVFIVAIFVLLRLTRDYAYRYATPEIVAAGIPVDIDAISKRQHEEGMGPVIEPATPRLVQIGGVGSAAPAAPAASAFPPDQAPREHE